MNHDRDTLLAEIATRYYMHDQSQQEIADQLDLSRSNISRLLKEARERGIVEIFIRHPLGRDAQLEGQLRERFGSREIAETLSIAAQADVALVGIGAVDPSVSSLLRAGYVTPDEFRAIQRAGVVGDICARHFDIAGCPAAPEIDERLITISLDQLAR